MSSFGFNEYENYAQYAQYLASPAIPISTERILQCMKLILKKQSKSSEEGRFEDKLPKIKYMSEDELMKYLIKISNES